MEMTGPVLAMELERSLAILESQFEGMDVDRVRLKPAPKKWSMLEVLVHLWEAEYLDFRPRLLSALEDPERPWPNIEPELWVTERRYNERGLDEALAGFREERQKSLAWLRDLKEPDWRKVYHHPLGKIRTGDLMAAWVAHDHLHVGQLGRIQAWWIDQATPFSTRYANP